MKWGPFFVNELRVTVNTPSEARRAVDSQVVLGVDFIKVHQQISKLFKGKVMDRNGLDAILR